MVEGQRLISVICTCDDYTSFFSYLEEQAYTIQNYSCFEHAVKHEECFNAPVALVDSDSEGSQCFDYINEIHEHHPDIRVILVGDFKNSTFPDNIPRIFHFVRKPFSRDKLSAIIENAFTMPFGIERRREPRIALQLPVDLYYKASVFRTYTNNISLHGMQAVWPEEGDIAGLAEKHEEGNSPIGACRLFLSTDPSSEEDEHLNIPVTLRYIKKNIPTLMGFEFRDLDLDLRTKLQEVVIW